MTRTIGQRGSWMRSIFDALHKNAINKIKTECVWWHFLFDFQIYSIAQTHESSEFISWLYLPILVGAEVWSIMCRRQLYQSNRRIMNQDEKNVSAFYIGYWGVLLDRIRNSTEKDIFLFISIDGVIIFCLLLWYCLSRGVCSTLYIFFFNLLRAFQSVVRID